MIPGPTEMAAAKQRIRQLLIDRGFHSDHQPAWLTADEARQYAVEQGGASFSICPVCDARHPNVGPARLHEAVLRRHCESHTPEEWLRAIVRLQARIDRALDVCGSGVDALLDPGPLKRRVSAARVRAALRGPDGS